MKKTLLPLLAASLLGTTAMAADLPGRSAPLAPAPAMMPIFTWAGFYAGVQGGYAWGNGSGGGFNAAGAQISAASQSPSGLFGGLHAGYNWQNGSLVLGGEVDAEVSGVRKDNLGIAGNGVKSEELFRASFRLRAGVAFDRALLYATGGLAIADLKNTYNSFVVGQPLFAVDSTRTGWTLGAGLEYAFTNNWSGRVEYRYTKFGSQNDAGFPAAFGALARANWNYNDSAIRVGLTYHFNAPAGPVVAKY